MCQLDVLAFRAGKLILWQWVPESLRDVFSKQAVLLTGSTEDKVKLQVKTNSCTRFPLSASVATVCSDSAWIVGGGCFFTLSLALTRLPFLFPFFFSLLFNFFVRTGILDLVCFESWILSASSHKSNLSI